MNDPETLEQLSHRVDTLEQRVHKLEALETARPSFSSPQPPPAAATAKPLSDTVAAVEPLAEEPATLFPVLGKALLGIAGAYLLRALESSAVIPQLVIVTLAIAYALAWLIWASRIEARNRIAASIYAATSALILAPMLWELVLRFQILSPLAAAAVLILYAATASVLAWKHTPSPTYSIAHATAALTAFALAAATHTFAPFLAALLALVLISELAATLQHAHAIRPAVSFLTALAVAALFFIYSGPANAHADYPSISLAALLAPACVLFFLTAAALTARVTLQRQPAPVLDIAQAIVSFLLASAGVLLFAPPAATRALGAICLVLSAACYAASFVLFGAPNAPRTDRRNYCVFGLWGAALLLAGSYWTIASPWLALFLAAATIATFSANLHRKCRMLELHGILYLLAAAIVSGLLPHATSALVGTPPVRPTWPIYLAALTAIAAYAIAREREGEDWLRQILHFAAAFLATLATAAFLAQAFVALAPAAVPVPFLRTLTLCLIALALAFAGPRLHRPEMTRLAYASLIFLAAKLLFEDLPHARMEFIAASIFLFALTLIAVPRLKLKPQKAA